MDRDPRIDLGAPQQGENDSEKRALIYQTKDSIQDCFKKKKNPSAQSYYGRGSNYYYYFLRATSVAYGSSQARGQIGAAAGSLHHGHSNIGSKLHL